MKKKRLLRKKGFSNKPARKRIFKRTGTFYVYIVECADGTLYNGYTPDIERRIHLHNTGRGAKYTRERRPVKLVWLKKYRYFRLAFLEEMRIKSLGRKRKEVLISSGKRR
jgi:putative endonuclease